LICGKEQDDISTFSWASVLKRLIEIDATYPIAVLDRLIDRCKLWERVEADSPIAEDACFPDARQQEDLLNARL
jgi:hypothetical protein